MTDPNFELIIDLPCMDLDPERRGLIGFDIRYNRIRRDLQILLDPDSVNAWSVSHHKTVLPICALLADRYPLIVFHGDVGTGKTATTECSANRLAVELQREGTLLKLSTRVRGKGLHGEMSKLIGESFDRVRDAAGKKRLAFLLIDEADALATSREGTQLHQEEKAGTNTLIQRLDDLRSLRGRAVVFLATNRLHALDPAVVRRAARLECFDRPTAEERRELLRHDLKGIKLPEEALHELVRLTGADEKHGRLGFTFSDLRTRFLPNAILASYPDAALTAETLLEAARTTPPSPTLSEE